MPVTEFYTNGICGWVNCTGHVAEYGWIDGLCGKTDRQTGYVVCVKACRMAETSWTSCLALAAYAGCLPDMAVGNHVAANAGYYGHSILRAFSGNVSGCVFFGERAHGGSLTSIKGFFLPIRCCLNGCRESVVRQLPRLRFFRQARRRLFWTAMSYGFLLGFSVWVIR